MAISQHFSSLLLFIGLFYWVYNDRINANHLVWLANLFTITGYIAWISYVQWWRGIDFREEGKQVAKSAIIFLMILLGLVPVFKTLTENISNDTIYALTTFLFVMNMIFHR